MAGLGRNDFDQGDTLFVSPDNLMIDHDLNSCFRHPQHHQQQPDQYSTSAQQAGSVSFSEQQQQQQRPNLNLPIHPQSSYPFRPNPPLTPITPFRPLTEDERLAFPCLGGPEDCWNPSLCPKHRAYPDTPSSSESSSQTSSQHPTRRRSCPDGDGDGDNNESTRIKPKRHSTAPERPILHSRSHSGRVPHNLIERRYRDNLNHQIENLRLVLPSLKDETSTSSSDNFDFSPRQPSKAMVISTATKYIRDMEIERKRLVAANEALQNQVENLQRLVRREDLGVVGYLNAMSRMPSHSHNSLATP